MKKMMFVLAIAALSVVAGANLIQNGSFETCQPGFEPDTNWGVIVEYPGLPAGTGSLDNWTITHASNWGQFYWYFANGGGENAQDGVRFMNLTTGANQSSFESISQSFDVTADTTYTVSYYERVRAAGATLTSAIALATGSAAGTLSQIANAGADWTLFSYSFTPDTTTTATLKFSQTAWATGLDDGVFLDNVSVVPEPLTMALLGLGGLFAARRRS